MKQATFWKQKSEELYKKQNQKVEPVRQQIKSIFKNDLDVHLSKEDTEIEWIGHRVHC